jgi:hypothetical protein
LNPIWELFELVLLWTDFEAFFFAKTDLKLISWDWTYI